MVLNSPSFGLIITFFGKCFLLLFNDFVLFTCNSNMNKFSVFSLVEVI